MLYVCVCVGHSEKYFEFARNSHWGMPCSSKMHFQLHSIGILYKIASTAFYCILASIYN